MRFPRKRGATSVKIRIFIPDNSVTTGAGCTGLVYNSTNLAISFSRAGQNGGTEITGANITQISTIGTWAEPGTGKAGFGAVDATKFPGLYEIHVADDCAAFAVGDSSEAVYWNIYEKTTTALKIGPNMVLIPLSSLNVLNGESDVVKILATTLTETVGGYLAAAFKKFFDKSSPTGTINSLPDAVAGANGGLPTTNGTKVSQTVDLTAGQSIAVSDKTGFSLVGSEHNAIADAYLDRTDAIETGLTPRNAHRLEVASAAGQLSGAGTGTETLKSAVSGTKNRIVGTIDVNGNRTITTDLT